MLMPFYMNTFKQVFLSFHTAFEYCKENAGPYHHSWQASDTLVRIKEKEEEKSVTGEGEKSSTIFFLAADPGS